MGEEKRYEELVRMGLEGTVFMLNRNVTMRFRHPLIQHVITDYMQSGYQAYAFPVSYGTVTGG